MKYQLCLFFLLCLSGGAVASDHYQECIEHGVCICMQVDKWTDVNLSTEALKKEDLEYVQYYAISRSLLVLHHKYLYMLKAFDKVRAQLKACQQKMASANEAGSYRESP